MPRYRGAMLWAPSTLVGMTVRWESGFAGWCGARIGRTPGQANRLSFPRGRESRVAGRRGAWPGRMPGQAGAATTGECLTARVAWMPAYAGMTVRWESGFARWCGARIRRTPGQAGAATTGECLTARVAWMPAYAGMTVRRESGFAGWCGARIGRTPGQANRLSFPRRRESRVAGRRGAWPGRMPGQAGAATAGQCLTAAAAWMPAFIRFEERKQSRVAAR